MIGNVRNVSDGEILSADDFDRDFNERGGDLPEFLTRPKSEMSAKMSAAKAARLAAAAAFTADELHWSPDLVRARLREAARVVERVVTRPGPSRRMGKWPADVLLEFSDKVGRVGTGQLAADQAARNREALRNEAIMSGASDREITRAEEALRWPAVYLDRDEIEPERLMLQVWMSCESGRVRQSFREAGPAAGQCSKTTAYARRDRAFALIASGLIADGTPA